MQEIYISTDVESDGPIPGIYSMLNFGSVALLADKTVLGTFERNLKPLENARQDPDTMRFWARNPKAWAYVTSNTVDATLAMQEYADWLDEMSKHGTLVFLAYPAGYDFMFIKWYMEYFLNKCHFQYQALDIKSYAMAVMKTQFSNASKSNMPKEWFDELPHTHTGLDDAMNQGMMFCNMLSANS